MMTIYCVVIAGDVQDDGRHVDNGAMIVRHVDYGAVITGDLHTGTLTAGCVDRTASVGHVDNCVVIADVQDVIITDDCSGRLDNRDSTVLKNVKNNQS